ncbi:MAG: DUF1338 domain-containing protein [Bacteroidetes bacterium HGW-Bacteroidetes-6]|nr:MAG: DUF1338 domain-containing protein [Bacteroidetes bacterium HGW-Bacteroidetes-6]
MQKELFDRLWTDYTTKNPHAKNIFKAFADRGEQVLNDHIAFRTINQAGMNIDTLAQAFIEAGYVEKGRYVFESKKLQARHYEIPNDDTAPLVFISELETELFSSFLQQEMKKIAEQMPEDLKNNPNIIFSGRTWGLPSFAVYEKLRTESEYAAWFYVNGYTVNHFTVSVNQLKTMTNIADVNAFLKEQGYQINDAGGEVQGTPEELLEQSSVKAPLMEVEFQEGVFEVPGCYYEFAKRYNDADGKLYRKFIAKSADKIFQSTDYYRS